MKKIIVSILLIVMIVFTITCFSGCSNSKAYSFSSVNYFKTQIDIVLYAKNKEQSDEIFSFVNIYLKNLENKVSVYKADSDISQFNSLNQGETLEINATTYELLLAAKREYISTNHAFNPLVYRLSDLWGFTDRFNSNSFTVLESYDRSNFLNELPDEKYIEGFASLLDFDKVEVYSQDNKYFIKKPEDVFTISGNTYTYALDLGGIAKGFAVDGIRNIIDQYSLTKGYISVGSSSIFVYDNNGINKTWKVNIKNPINVDNNYDCLKLNMTNISTSGDYENYYEIDNVRYCHIINPFTGKPIQTGIVSATVTGANAAMMDVASTAICVLGEDKAKEYIQNNFINNEHVRFIVLKEGSYILVSYENGEFSEKRIVL